MQKAIKRMGALFLCAALALPAAACGQTKTTEASAVSDTAPVTIKWLAYQTLGQPDPNSAVCQAVEKKFNVKFDIMYVDWNNWDDQLNVKMAGNDIPDVFLVWDQNHLARYVQQGILAELPWSTIEKKAPNYIKVIQKYDKDNIIPKYAMYNNKNYGFTNINLNYTYPNPIIWRTDWLKNVGITKIPTTLDEFEAAMLKFRNDDPDQNGKKDTYGMSNTMIPAIFAAYGLTTYGVADVSPCALTNLNGKIVWSSTTSEAKQVVTKLAQWYQEGIIDPEYVTGEHTSGYAAISNAFESSKIGVTGLGSFYHYNPPLTDGDAGGAVYQDFKKNNPNMQYAPGKPIVGPTGKSGAVMPNYASGTIGFSAQGVKNQRIVDATLAMLNAAYSNDEAYYMMVNYGTKDTDYTTNAQGVVTASPSLTSAKLRQEGIGVFNLFGNNPDFIKKVNAPLYKYADENYNYTALATPFITPTKDYMDANTEYFQNLQKLTIQAYTDMITGKSAVGTAFDAYVKQFNGNGGTAIQDAANTAVKSK